MKLILPFLWKVDIKYVLLMNCRDLIVESEGRDRYLMNYGDLDKCSNEVIVEQIIILRKK